MIIASQAKKASDLLHRFRRNPINNCLDYFGIDGDVFHRNDMSEIYDFRKLELTLKELGIETMFVKLH